MLEILLAHFKSASRKNHAIEALNLLSQYHLWLPDRLAQQLIWCHFVNTHGKPGCNIPCDLYLEHCNRVCKIAIRGIGANLMPKALQRIGKGSGQLLKIIEQFDTESGVSAFSTEHTMPSFKKDLHVECSCEAVEGFASISGDQRS